MRPIEAKSDLGPCGGCGVSMDRGEFVVLHGAGTTHANCIPRVGVTSQSETTAGFLFADPAQAESERVKEQVGAASLAIHGATYSERRDKDRITKHLLAVFELLKDGSYRSTASVAEAVGCQETTAHARMRQLRAIGHQVPKRWVKGEDGASGHFEYALVINRSLVSDEWERQHGSRAA